jgi:hypothetical protein
MLLRVSGRNRVAEILLQAKVIDDLQLRSALGYLSQWGGRLAHAVTEKRFATEDEVVAALGAALRLEPIHLANIPRDAAALARLDADYCRDKGVFPVALKDGGRTLLLAMADPTDDGVAEAVSHRGRARITVALAGELQIRAAIDRLYLGREAAVGPARAPARKAPEPEPPPEIPPEAQAPVAAPRPTVLGAEALARLQSIVQNQQRSGQILQALTELLLEKGCLTPADLSGRLKPPV